MDTADDLTTAEHATNTGLTFTEYVVIAATTGWNDAGEEVSQVFVIPEGSQHRAPGLTEHARLRVHADVLAVLADPADPADPADET